MRIVGALAAVLAVSAIAAQGVAIAGDTTPAASATAQTGSDTSAKTPAAEPPKAGEPTSGSAAADTSASSPAGTAASHATPGPDAGKTEAGKPAETTSGAANSSSSTASPAAPASGDAAPATAATTPAPSPSDEMANAILTALRLKLADSTAVAKISKEDVEALTAFYGDRKEPLWTAAEGFTAKGKAVASEIGKADDWGLDRTAFDIPALTQDKPPADVLAEAEFKLSVAALKYARYARGGRTTPRSISRILDMDPPVKESKTVVADLAASATPDAYLRGLHPKHEQFERLRQALIKARGPTQDEGLQDPALKIKLPEGKTLKVGDDHPTVALLRQRLKVKSDPGQKDTTFDAKLAEALTSFQSEKGLTPSGKLSNATRAALNAEGEPKKASGGQNVQRILVNMEKWRWMPENLGKLYVWDNVPEFYARVMKDDKEIFKEKIIVGMPEWATPTFSAEMQFIVFNPSWGVPDGIKMRELLPRLQRAGGGGFFDQLFGGGGGGAGVLQAYGLTAYYNGKPVDPNSVSWGSVDIRNYSFTQPPGGKNPLGFVKFRFPNKHDVYMHDTVQRELFAQSFRAMSHGCMRVQNPRRLADLLLAEDKGWSPERVGQAIGSSGEITLDKPIPVHVTYFTALVDDSGKMTTFGDLYGHDSRIAAALTGRAVEFDRGSSVETASADDVNGVEYATDAPIGPAGKKKGKNKSLPGSKYKSPESLSDIFSGLVSN